MRITNPYHAAGDTRVWLKGNLHTHSVLSDGALELQEVVQVYADRGYDFLAITDHDRLISESELSQLDALGLILIPGNEISSDGPHIVHVDAPSWVAPDPDRQRVLDEVAAVGGFAVMAHPNWKERFDYCSMEQLAKWHGYTGIEIFNGVIGRLAGSPYATGKWDMLLSSGHTVWGLAHDDYHRPQDEARGWIVVSVAERTKKAVLAALRRGAFYASTGVAIERVDVDREIITVETADAHRIIASVDYGRRVKEVDGSSMSLEVPQSAGYVRFTCLGVGEACAWTQPFFLAS
jgi:hypothetical protein